jgi:lysozyme family protein
VNFDQAFDALIGSERGYVNDPQDPGGETNWGISKRAYPNVDIKALTREDAKVIYKSDFWDRVKADELPELLRFSVFDAAVNSGVIESIQWLQSALQVKVDGVLGPVTLGTANTLSPTALVAKFNGIRLGYMTNLPNWEHDGRGWARRIAKNLSL